MKKSVPKKRGRPFLGGRDPVTSLRMPPEIRVRLEEFARQEGLTVSKAILRLVELGLTVKLKQP